MSDIAYTQNNTDQGELKIQVTARRSNRPITNARIAISYSGDPDSIVEEVNTDASGMSEQITLPAPPLEFSMEPGEEQPFSQYSIQVDAEGFRPFTVSGIELFSKQLSLQEVRMDEVDAPGNPVDTIVIPVNTLWGDFPPKIAESEIKPISETGEIVLSRVVVPEYVVVHDGPPNDTTARDYYVRYKDYIKDVASSEIYSTWPDATLRANILAIMSFTLNRVYTEWYRNKGYSFTITSSTAYDQKFTYGRNIFQSISDIVDEMFQNFLSRPNVSQPILTQYCDGERVTCSNWLSQWGSKYLGDQNYEAIEILRYYYGTTCTSTRQKKYPASRLPGRESTLRSVRPAKKCVRSRRNLHGFQDPIRRFRQLHRTESTDLPQERLSRSSSVSSVCRSPASLTTVPGIKFLKFMWQYRASRNWSKCKWGQSHPILCAASPNLFLCSDTRSFSPFRTLFHISFYFASLIPPSLPSPSFLAYPRQIPCRKKHNKQVTAVPRMPALP